MQKKAKIIIVILCLIIVLVVGALVYLHFNEEVVDTPNYNDSPHIPLNYGPDEKKPIIYIYPEEEMDLTIKLGIPNNISYSYPEYNNGWEVKAYPGGKLIDKKTNRELYALYWEGKVDKEVKINEGFVVRDEDTTKFLEEKLSILGLNDREIEEFIIYWMPILKENKYNLIRFATPEEINEYMPLEVSIKPDTMIRVLMEYKPLDERVEVEEQVLKQTTRSGYTIVEWGGMKAK